MNNTSNISSEACRSRNVYIENSRRGRGRGVDVGGVVDTAAARGRVCSACDICHYSCYVSLVCRISDSTDTNWRSNPQQTPVTATNPQ